MSGISTNFYSTFVSNIWLTLLLIILTPLYIDFLGVEYYGLVGFYATFVTIITIFDTGISSTATREISWKNKKNNPNEIFFKIRSLEITYIIYILIVFFILSSFIFLFGKSWFVSTSIPQEEIKNILFLMLISLLLQVPSGLYTGSLFGFKKHTTVALYLSVLGAIRGFGIIIVFYFYHVSIYLFFIWYIIVNLIQIIILRYQVYKNFQNTIKLTYKIFKKSFINFRSFLTGIIILTLISVFLSQIDKFYLSKIISLELFSCFMIAYTITAGITRLSNPIFSTFTPYFNEAISTNNFNELNKNLYLSGRLVALISIPTLITISFQSNIILDLWIGDSFVVNNSNIILKILCVASLFNLFSYPFLSVLIVKKKFRELIIINFSLLIVSLFFLIPLINNYNLIGAAIWWLIICTIIFLSYSYLFVKNFEIKFLNYIINIFIYPITICLFINSFLKMIQYSDSYIINLLQLFIYLVINYVMIIFLLKNYRFLISNFLLYLK